MAPNGPILPRKSTALARSKGNLEAVAFQIGVIVAVERNRKRLTQTQLATTVGIDQVDVSALENGQPAAITDAQTKALFKALGLDPDGVHCHYVMWWRKNSTL
jgi:transcriptional regulator with XRE-family HTH domain